MKRVLALIALTAVCMVTTVTNTFAAGTLSVSADKEGAVVGDTYTVSITLEGTEGAASAPEVSVNYNANRLEFASCSAEYGGGAGGLITLSSGGDITFNVLSGGQADVSVSAIFDGDGANQQAGNVSLYVEGEDTAAAMDASTQDSGTGIEAGSIATPDGKVVSAVFADEFMPIGFYKTTVSYEEQMVEAAQFDMGGIVLLYVTDADGNNGNFDIYDQQTGSLSDFLQISGIENRFIIALKATEDVEIPDNFTKADLQWNSQQLEAYAYTGEALTDQAVNPSDFFLLYAVSSEGNKGWYMYDQSEGTYQRYVQGLHGAKTGSDDNIISQITSAAASSDEEGGINIILIVAIALAVLLLVLIITVIVMAVKLHEYNSYDYIDEDEPESQDNYFNRLASAVEQPMMPVRNEIPNDLEEAGAKEENPYPNVPEEFTVRRKAKIDRSELAKQDSYERDIDEERLSSRDVNDGYFSPRNIDDEISDDEIDDEEDYPRKLSRAEKKAMKQAEKARKKEEKRLKREYGEYGPVDWDSWQNGVEGGERTASAHMNRGSQEFYMEDESIEDENIENIEERDFGVDERAARRNPDELQRRTARQNTDEVQLRDERSEAQPAMYPKGNPMDMMRSIPANDNNAPVQAKPVQQFDFDDDFEFEFLKLDDED